VKQTAKVLQWVIGGLVTSCFVVTGILYLTSLKYVRRADADKKKCDSELVRLQQDLPIGTSREDVLRYLQIHNQNIVQFVGDGDQVSVNLGKVQSTVWYCSFFVEYADISFISDIAQNSGQRSLSRIETKSLGECL
jgi:hypothetical protein